uniref:DUF3598 domain-containing protein n=1 Tax=Rhodosorus marinus TaxID=101924 RepID=A0A7S2ZBA5_9RHOD|mmetsp:Transcript_12377/g.50764  ORF Transcript_12377/g.50764 Transcript_12377/m.50764 type:complete len:319 (+) Transcript_12377:3-959(+)
MDRRWMVRGEDGGRWDRGIGGGSGPFAEGSGRMSWSGFVNNVGEWEGRRVLYNGNGVELLDVSTSARVERVDDPEGVRWRTEAYREGGEVDIEDVEWTRRDVDLYGAAVESGSYSLGPSAIFGENFKIDQGAVASDVRVCASYAYDWEGKLSGLIVARERRTNVVQRAIEPSAWNSSAALFDYYLGTWEGSGIITHRQSGRSIDVSSRIRLNFNLNGNLHQVSSLSVIGGQHREVQSTAARDGSILLFANAGVQMFLLPGGVSIASPIIITRGEPFVVELAFLVRPDERIRIARCYNADGAWMNTVFLQERRVASLNR